MERGLSIAILDFILFYFILKRAIRIGQNGINIILYFEPKFIAYIFGE
jgi:hypothetical protein